MEEGIDHLRLKLGSNPTYHSEIEERQVPAVHDEQVPRMRIRVEETVFKQLLQVSANQKSVHFDWRNAVRLQAFDVYDLGAANKVECKHSRVRV